MFMGLEKLRPCQTIPEGANAATALMSGLREASSRAASDPREPPTTPIEVLERDVLECLRKSVIPEVRQRQHSVAMLREACADPARRLDSAF
jgi:hypothetical protein